MFTTFATIFNFPDCIKYVLMVEVPGSRGQPEIVPKSVNTHLALKNLQVV